MWFSTFKVISEITILINRIELLNKSRRSRAPTSLEGRLALSTKRRRLQTKIASVAPSIITLED